MTKILNMISDFLVRRRQRHWRKWVRKNRVCFPDGAVTAPRLRLESSKYLDVTKYRRT